MKACLLIAVLALAGCTAAQWQRGQDGAAKVKTGAETVAPYAPLADPATGGIPVVPALITLGIALAAGVERFCAWRKQVATTADAEAEQARLKAQRLELIRVAPSQAAVDLAMSKAQEKSG